jgi:hypothetical protein
MEIEKIERLRSLFAQVSDISSIKREMANVQNYAEAAAAREVELKLISEIDEIIGVKGYFNELIRMEKINFHIENVEKSIKALKKLDFKLVKPLGIQIDSEALVSLHKQQLEIQNQILNFRLSGGLPEKKFDEKLAF